MPAIEIDRNGDVTLQLTKNLPDGSDDGMRSLLVSSKVLELASPVFAVMLSPRFREGQRSAGGKLDPIPLPDDDAEAVTILCHIFHFNYAALPAKPELKLFKNLALLCDKYDCVAPLRFISEQWLLKWEATAQEEELEILLFISYVFDRAERLAALSTRIVKEFGGNLKQLAVLREFDAVPEELLRGLQQQRRATLKGIEEAITTNLDIMDVLSHQSFPISSAKRFCTLCLRFVEPSVQLCSKCRVSTVPAICSRQSRRGEYVEILKEAGLNPVRLWSTMAVMSVTEIAASIATAREASSCHDCDSATDCLLKNTFVILNKDAAALASSAKGLCLDCIKVGHETVGLKPECTVGHGKNAPEDLEHRVPVE